MADNEVIARKVQFDLGTGEAAILLEHPFGSLLPATNELHFDEHMARRLGAPPGENWGNEDVLAEAQRLLDEHPTLGGKGYRVVLPPKPLPRPEPVDEPPPLPAAPAGRDAAP